jgi:pimeloyl-ACP methyl ester carboxylesterase
MRTVHTELLEIAFDEGGPENGPPGLLLHGWPDAPRGWGAIAAALTQKACIRSHRIFEARPTRFLSNETPCVGAGVALAQDAIDLADQLGVGQFAVVGHDWGGQSCLCARSALSGTSHKYHSPGSCVSTAWTLQNSPVRSGQTLLISMVPLRRRRHGEGPARSVRIYAHTMGHLESRRLVRRGRVFTDCEELSEPRLGRDRIERLSFPLARRRSLGFALRSAAAETQRSGNNIHSNSNDPGNVGFL